MPSFLRLLPLNPPLVVWVGCLGKKPAVCTRCVHDKFGLAINPHMYYLTHHASHSKAFRVHPSYPNGFSTLMSIFGYSVD